jgi:hypothetical protein
MDGPENLKQMSREKKNQGLKTPPPRTLPQKVTSAEKKMVDKFGWWAWEGRMFRPFKNQHQNLFKFFLNNKKISFS